MAKKYTANAAGTRQDKLNRFFAVYCGYMNETGKVDVSISRLCAEASVARVFFYPVIGSIASVPNVAFEQVCEKTDALLMDHPAPTCTDVLRVILDAALACKYAVAIVMRNAGTRAAYNAYVSALLEKYVFLPETASKAQNEDIQTMNSLFFFYSLGNVIDEALFKAATCDTEAEAQRIVAVMRGIRSAKKAKKPAAEEVAQ